MDEDMSMPAILFSGILFSGILSFGIGMPGISGMSVFGMLIPGMLPPCGMAIPSMLCASAGAAMTSNAEISSGAFAIAHTVEATMEKGEAKILAKKNRALRPDKEKGRVQNTRPFLRS